MNGLPSWQMARGHGTITKKQSCRTAANETNNIPVGMKDLATGRQR